MSLVFVFGSNTSGRHGKGAALAARRYHGAVYGVAKGMTGNSYALPTCNDYFQPLSLDLIKDEVEDFLGFAAVNPQLGFQVTRIGCGLAYYKDEDIAPMFRQAPQFNVFFDEKWRPFLGNGYDYWGSF
ncbi:hypothetical protein [Mesorhizobium sp. M4B.F.Ca.ET.058.02.1.1]|uniref:A1S_2505 family phage non-structural protein n=1 Tax=Mesorhizobium sp. M4B.F.Ca.ET.058.02.1.1 TaxID=2493675 RepID=UPI000F74E44E|nr:hypothetical protein [Mesorhizobium sp. M4B.F.Ca.ET.058.02.1.1]AZO48077.1 hypothetical protein EJ073_09790 [Mesorhizobium sp. M4B.F.Ca.ET.058.02.1.1]TJX71217.1 MAG: hypothetical protein E5W21_07730 [Mesorhizobium sp.]